MTEQTKSILKQELLKNKKFRDEYYKNDLAFDISQMVIEARVDRGMTQEELAKRIGTKQPSIARVENGRSLPSLSLLEKIARAFGTHLIPPSFAPIKVVVNYDSTGTSV